jgi:hypothetical protein
VNSTGLVRAAFVCCSGERSFGPLDVLPCVALEIFVQYLIAVASVVANLLRTCFADVSYAGSGWNSAFDRRFFTGSKVAWGFSVVDARPANLLEKMFGTRIACPSLYGCRSD